MNLITTLLISLCALAALMALGVTSSFAIIGVGFLVGWLTPFKTFTPKKKE